MRKGVCRGDKRPLIVYCMVICHAKRSGQVCPTHIIYFAHKDGQNCLLRWVRLFIGMVWLWLCAISAEKPEVVIWLITSLCQLGYGINPRCCLIPWRFQKCVVVLKTWNGLLWIYLAAYGRGVATIDVIIIFDCKIIILYNV